MSKKIQLKDKQGNNLYPNIDASQLPTIPKYPVKTFTTGNSKELKIPLISTRGSLIIGATAMGATYGIASGLYYFFWNDNFTNQGMKKIIDNSSMNPGTGDGNNPITNYTFDKDNKMLTITTSTLYTNGFIVGYIDTNNL